jgi:hypothetical protein
VNGDEPAGPLSRRLEKRQRKWAKRVLDKKAKGRVLHEANPTAPDLLDDFRFYAVLGTWMEGDIVEATVRNAFAQGVEAVYVVDNASTDDTVDRALAAGATLVETFATKQYEERIRILLMNGVVARISLASGAPHVWWLWLDADEFPEGPGAMTIAEYLRTLDRRFRVVGSTYYNHFPHEKPEYIPGFHPLDFQPLGERYTSKHVHHCKQPHWKHPLQRFDDEGPFIMASGGFHTGELRTREPLWEPTGGIVTHHICYRQEEAARTRLELLCGTSERNAFNDSIGNRTIQRRFESLDAVYAQDWAHVNNLRGSDPVLGVHPTAWPDPDSSRRWYSAEDVASAKKKALADYPPSSPG